MKDELNNAGWVTTSAGDRPAMPAVVDRTAFQAELDALRQRRARLATGGGVAGRTPHRPVVATRSWTL